MTLDLTGGWRLLLAGSQRGGFWLAAGGLALVLLLVLYREERKLVSRRAGMGLLALRIVAALVLVAALFEPIAARSYREVLKGRVIVAVDVSESMATADPGRSADEGQRLAKTLKLSPGAAVDRLSRREVARRLIEGSDSPVARLAKEHSVEALSFAKETASASLASLVEALGKPGRRDDPATLATDWQPALAEALKGSDAAPVIGVVLMTDGRQNVPGDPVPTVDRLVARGIPVFPVLIGSTTPPRDAAIATVKAPESVYKGDVASIEVALKLDGYAGREVEVTLERPGAPPMRETVKAPADGSRPVVAFRVPLDEVGAVPMTVALTALDGDVRPDNDRRTVTVQVADDKARVLLVDGEARWEFRYLRNALARDPRVEVRAVVFHQPAIRPEAGFQYDSTLPIQPDQPAGAPDPLGAFDAIVIGDVDPADLPAEAWARLEKYVAERGGTLILSSGPRFGAALAAQETARKLLPVLDPRPVAIDPAANDPAHPSLPPGVAVAPSISALADIDAWPMLQFATEPEQNRRIWTGMPGLPWVMAGKGKPGATVLATTRDESAAVIAAQPYGLGKVLWVGTDGTWRWRYRAGDVHHHRFWGQTVRWAASGKLAAGNPYVRFGPVRPRVPEGEGARIQARIAEGIAGVGPDLLIAARVFPRDAKTGEPTGEAVAVVPLRMVAGQPRTFEGAAPSLPLGAYVVRLDVPQLAEVLHLDASPQAPKAALDVVARDTSERIELAAARDPLDRLAAAPGGRVVADFEADVPRPDPGNHPDRRDPALGPPGHLPPVCRRAHRRVGRPETRRLALIPALTNIPDLHKIRPPTHVSLHSSNFRQDFIETSRTPGGDALGSLAHEIEANE